MKLLARHSSKLSTVFVLLIIVRECLMENGEAESPQVPDPNADQANQSAPAKPSKVAGFRQKFTPNREKWRRRSQNFVELFKTKPAEQKDTLKEIKVVLVTFYKLMDSKIFDRCANPLSFRIDHFDVKNHLFTKQYIKVSPNNERFMNIYHKFLDKCCHPLIDMYQQRLNDDQTEEQKIGNLKFRLELNSIAEQPKSILKPPSESLTDEATNSEDPSQQKPPAQEEALSLEQKHVRFPEPSPPPPPPAIDASSQPPPSQPGQPAQRGNKAKQWLSQGAKTTRHGLVVGGKKTLSYAGKATWMTLKSPAYPYKGVKYVAGGVNKQLVRHKLKKGPFQPQYLTYWQKAFIYRTVKWATPFLVVPKYSPSRILKRKLEEIVEKHGMNLLDPENDNLHQSAILLDCIPIKPSDLENCCLDKDRSIEHLYLLSHIYNKEKQRKKEEKKRLGTNKDEKEEKIDKSKLSKKAKFRLKMKKDLDKCAINFFYGFYPNVPSEKELAIRIIKAFKVEKFKEIFSMKPKQAKKIIRKRYKLRKYQEKAEKFKMERTQVEPATKGQIDSQSAINDANAGEGQGPSVQSLQTESTQTKSAKTETWQQTLFVKPWYLLTGAVTECFSGCFGSKNEKQSTEAQNGPYQNSAHTDNEPKMTS